MKEAVLTLVQHLARTKRSEISDALYVFVVPHGLISLFPFCHVFQPSGCPLTCPPSRSLSRLPESSGLSVSSVVSLVQATAPHELTQYLPLP
jgi:hypothetical protein